MEESYAFWGGTVNLRSFYIGDDVPFHLFTLPIYDKIE